MGDPFLLHWYGIGFTDNYSRYCNAGIPELQLSTSGCQSLKGGQNSLSSSKREPTLRSKTTNHLCALHSEHAASGSGWSPLGSSTADADNSHPINKCFGQMLHHVSALTRAPLTLPVWHGVLGSLANFDGSCTQWDTLGDQPTAAG